MKKVWYCMLVSVSCNIIGDITPTEFLAGVIELAPRERPMLVPWLKPTWQQLSASEQAAFKTTIGAGRLNLNQVQQLVKGASLALSCPELRLPTQKEIEELFAAVGIAGSPSLKQLDALLKQTEAQNVDIYQLVNARDPREVHAEYTPLIVLVLKAYKLSSDDLQKMLDLLLNAGACVNTTDIAGMTALMHAAIYTKDPNKTAIIKKTLLQYGATDPRHC